MEAAPVTVASATWTFFKPIARGMVGVATILGGCFMAGWGGAWGLQKIFDTQFARAELRTDTKIVQVEANVKTYHDQDMRNLNDKYNTIVLRMDAQTIAFNKLTTKIEKKIDDD